MPNSRPALELHAQCMHTEVMRAIQIRNVPDDVHATLQRRATDAGQSLQEYLLMLLSTHASRPTMAEWVRDAARGAASSSVTHDELIDWVHEDRDR